MKIQFDKETMPDDLYNMLLMHFVQEAIIQGVEVKGSTLFDNWTVSCEVKAPVH
jgi:hypothetical protein